MATGPRGRQGIQGDYGSRGITGAPGWGYATTSGPTGSIGTINISIPGSSSFSLTTANASSLFRLQNASANTVTCTLPSGLTTDQKGLFWSFSNDLSTDNSITLVTSGSETIKVIPRYASISIVYNGGTSTSLSSYILF
jgi:hypothetical protein